ncbi:MAG: dihydroorotase family protein [Nakamurella sp.]
MATYDLLLTNVRVVRPDRDEVPTQDVAISDGKFAKIADHIDRAQATSVVDGGGKLAFPGAVDAHQHWGIYSPLSEDCATESRASAQGGVTTGITYMRTGAYYMNKTGPYADIFPEVLAATQGRPYIDYGYHVAPINRKHLDEIGMLIDDFGVSSFKIFMFYGAYGLHGRSGDQAKFLMLKEGESYDVAHFEFVMRAIQAAREQRPNIANQISLSLHCETAEIMRAYTKLVEEEGKLTGLAAYSASRPPHSEGLAVTIASYLAYETALPTINLLHLSSRKAIEAAMMMATTFPHVDFRREVTIGHLLADITTASGIGAKVNPPIRPREDVEALWEHVHAGDISWVASDHACCRDEVKFGDPRDDVWLAKSGFGGTEYLLPGLISEGRKRGLPLRAIAQLTSWNPAQRFGLNSKGTIAAGYDADFALVDDRKTWTVRAANSESSQEYTPFEGFEMTAAVTDTYLRGETIYANGKVVGTPRGSYIRRPQANPKA